MTRHVFSCIDAHTCGNPVRVVFEGAPDLGAIPMAEKRAVFARDHDWIRRALMFEPRGHDIMSGVVLYPPAREDCDVGFLFIEVSGYLPMCGHGAIGTVTAMLEEGLVRPRSADRVAIETPAGRVDVEVARTGGFVDRVRLDNVASYLAASDVEIEVPSLGALTIDLAYGGNFYAIVEPQPNWPGLDAMTAAQILALSPLVRAAAQARLAPVHPADSRIQGVSHVMWCDAPRTPGADARNAVFYGEKAIDRSPCGTGSSARMAQLVAKGRLNVGDRFVHESIIGTRFDCQVLASDRVGPFSAIRPSIAGWAQVTGHNRIVVDDRDPLAHGFQLV
jgi:proline racemase